MDSENLETFEKTYSMIESEFMNFERKVRELWYELGRKRVRIIKKNSLDTFELKKSLLLIFS